MDNLENNEHLTLICYVFSVVIVLIMVSVVAVAALETDLTVRVLGCRL